ncbi:RNA polymerase sigma-70 factor [Alistipes sp. An116]|uniref:RNA polymerase sigma-70 factor n=1 Tax=Alistipes sp. An116 TaxID=1965546 RepID=UPI0013A5F361|nr:RNA polymerase sigma-70 factor [Alistipes sp. An116]
MKDKNKELADLLVSVSENNDYAFRVFYDLYYRNVFRFAYYFLKNREACREVVSNVFVAVWKSRVSLRQIVNVEAYLYVVVRNEANRYLKRSQSRPRSLSLDDVPAVVLDRRGDVSLQDGEASDSRLIDSEVEELLNRLVGDLPERCRMVFLLSRSEGLSVREIASMLSISESTVRVQIKIAVDRILEGLRRYYPDLKLITLLLLLFSDRL